MKKTVVFGITSGIAAYKSVELVRLLKNEDMDVLVVMTQAAAKMVSPKEFEKVSGNKVYTELFEQDFDYKDILKARKVDHIDLADRADVIVIAPATANVIAKLAHGMADDFLTTMILAATSPILLCPSMNVHMWKNPLVQENIQLLRKKGYVILDPEKGPLACGYEGQGRLPHLKKITDAVMQELSYTKSLAGKKILITAGGTQEKIDDVRFITNKSSGKMGISLAEECYMRGADVLLLRAKSSVEPRYLIKQEVFEDNDDLISQVKKYVKNYDIVFHTAAVSDFKPQTVHRGKISSKKSLSLDLTPARKISDDIKKLHPGITLIIFKAEHGLSDKVLVTRAKEKLSDSQADFVVANDISRSDRGFGVDTNEVIIVTKDGKEKKISLRSKNEIAKEVVHFIIEDSSFHSA